MSLFGSFKKYPTPIGMIYEKMKFETNKCYKTFLVLT